MNCFHFLTLFAIVSHCSASHLFVASYNGIVSTLDLSQSLDTTSYTLNVIAASSGCAGNSSWLTLDKPRGLLYCLDRGLTSANGSLNVLEIQENGVLVPVDRIPTPVGAASSVLYADNQALAVAYYSSSSVGSFDISQSSNASLLQTLTYSLSVPGADPAFESAPHPHQAILDPSGAFVVVPDLGADLLRIYGVNCKTKLLEPLEPFHAPVGSGPRHAAWLILHGKTYLYVVSQLTNVLTAYKVSYYKNQTLGFSPLFETSLLRTLGGVDLQPYSAAAEIQITPDKEFLVVSQRNDTSFNITNPSHPLGPSILSDSLLTYSISPSNGHLTLVDVSAAGGNFPRQFSINKAGDMIAVGLQNDGRVVIMRRDIKSGKILGFIAALDISGQVVCVVWDE